MRIKTNLIPLFILAALFRTILAHAQKQIKEYVTQKSVSIATIEPDSLDFSDLTPISDAIGDCRVVMLGEQDHGDAPAFLAKTRLIKYLHEKKGFNVLAFESDFFGLNEGWDKLNKQHPVIDTFIKKNVFGVWTVCNTCSNLFYSYIPGTYAKNSPLILSGFDSQVYLNYSYHNLSHLLDSTFRAANLPITKQSNYTSEILTLIDSPKKWVFFPPKDTLNASRCREYLTLARNQLVVAAGDDNFWTLVTTNLIQLTDDVLAIVKTGKQTRNGRDVQMAINLKWLIENKYKDQKIIVWAANIHIARYPDNVKAGFLKADESMGDYLAKSITNPNSVYIIGFTTYQGSAGRIGAKPYQVRPLQKNGFESWFNTGYKYAFVDFLKYNRQYPDANDNFYMCGLAHLSLSGKWNRVYDGMFFIRDVYPCERIKN